MIDRLPARKVRLADIVSGQWVQRQGMEPSVVVTPSGMELGRVRVLGTVVETFTKEDQSFGSLTLDDGTETLRAKVFKDLSPISEFAVGDVIDLVARVREFNGELYLNAEVGAKVTDPNIEILRAAELETRPPEVTLQPRPKEQVKDAVREAVLQLLEKNKDGLRFEDVFSSIHEPEAAVEQVVNDLLAEGVCYEPTPGRIRKI
ncbi:MAG: hypothetical protein KKA90_02735 [Nanoarchaeota archaeon]|nr:hypothetical protein [Nanoarchaeota archaeon]